MADRQTIYHLRHDIYARELGQHGTNSNEQLSDALDPHNIYLVAHVNDEIAGFISVTPPAAPHFSIDKYFTREELPFGVDAGTFEVRLLTVLKGFRGTELAMLLMYAAFRWVEAHGGTHIAAIGRREVLEIYLKSGLRQVGRSIKWDRSTTNCFTPQSQRFDVLWNGSRGRSLVCNRASCGTSASSSTNPQVAFTAVHSSRRSARISITLKVAMRS